MSAQELGVCGRGLLASGGAAAAGPGLAPPPPPAPRTDPPCPSRHQDGRAWCWGGGSLPRLESLPSRDTRASCTRAPVRPVAAACDSSVSLEKRQVCCNLYEACAWASLPLMSLPSPPLPCESLLERGRFGGPVCQPAGVQLRSWAPWGWGWCGDPGRPPGLGAVNWGAPAGSRPSAPTRPASGPGCAPLQAAHASGSLLTGP